MNFIVKTDDYRVYLSLLFKPEDSSDKSPMELYNFTMGFNKEESMIENSSDEEDSESENVTDSSNIRYDYFTLLKNNVQVNKTQFIDIDWANPWEITCDTDGNKPMISYIKYSPKKNFIKFGVSPNDGIGCSLQINATEHNRMKTEELIVVVLNHCIK